jgi:DNA polymerase (family 10)
MNNIEIAASFDQLADLLEIDGANAFRVRAYRNAARTIEGIADSLAGVQIAQLTEIPGIGDDLAKKIVELMTTGQLTMLEELKAKVPAGVVQMLLLPGIGPKKVAQLHKELGITSLAQLKQAAELGGVASLKGFGKKTEQTILEGIASIDQQGVRFYLADVVPLVRQIAEDLSKVAGVSQISPAGSVRRLKETIGDLDLLATSEDANLVMDALASHALVEGVIARGPTKQRVRLKSLSNPMTPGAQGHKPEMDLRVVPEKSFGAAMQYFTGSKEHNVVTRRLAKEKGLMLNEYGLNKGEEYYLGRTEEEIYAELGLVFVPPELRENREEFGWKTSADVPKLITEGEILGDLHMHTTESDGTASLEDMIAAARARGLKYIAITDHSKRVFMANGLNEERLLKQWEEIRRVREKYDDIKVLCGVECDILENATMDISDEVLAQADWIVAVIHFGLKQAPDLITKRLLTAIENPYVDCIGHMTGRLIGKRPGAQFDVETVFAAAKEHGVMLEINAHPARLDLSDVHASKARAMGIPIVINTDSHSTYGFEMLQWGIAQARRAGLSAENVANAWEFEKFEKSLRRNRKK